MQFHLPSTLLLLAATIFSAESRRLTNAATGFCLDSDTTGRVNAMSCNGGNFQQWQLYKDSTVRNVATGMCLDSNMKTEVYTGQCNGGKYQRWSISGGQFKSGGTLGCLDSNGDGHVYTHQCNGGAYQRWN
ncbi:actinohivin-like [Folsomia candida]|uniref:actinohivin-like n=1 Tax=Folsomia candida TaxID=158441 RepID=UPI000B8F2E39|nr:actinohivin-like [Folsomia candida]